MSTTIHIGIDFDNTIAGYDHVFCELAVEWKLVPEDFKGTKNQVREHILAHEYGITEWQRLQGQVYGRQMTRAKLIDGVPSFLRSCRERDIPLSIISHKTKRAHFDPDVNLREAALRWMTEQGFFERGGFDFDRKDVHFASTRTEKLGRISSEQCSHFVDDLIEVFEHPSFPSHVKGYLLSDGQYGEVRKSLEICSTWREISFAILG